MTQPACPIQHHSWYSAYAQSLNISIGFAKTGCGKLFWDQSQERLRRDVTKEPIFKRAGTALVTFILLFHLLFTTILSYGFMRLRGLRTLLKEDLQFQVSHLCLQSILTQFLYRVIEQIEVCFFLFLACGYLIVPAPF